MYADSRAVGDVVTEIHSRGFEQVFRQYYARVARLIARLVRDPGRAEELAVEVFWRLSRNPKALGNSAGGWLYRSAVRAGLYELRRQGRRDRFAHLLPLGERPKDPEELHAAAEAQHQVREILAAMESRQAELILLRASGLSYEELATALELNPASVGTLLSRAHQAFRKEYVQRYGER
ncbi:MAG TPA: sigma-70 family RNA polymerase sigma factor [Candidatus Acidoferrales bacterium]|nr:sigma-70 family RNA polymerase sigma factor [Candidatus Acidoferrales bacterium]